MEWHPSFLSRLFRKAAPWRLQIENDELSVTLSDQTYPIPLEAFSSLRFHRGLLWTNVTVWIGHEVRLVGLTSAARNALDHQLRVVTSKQHFRVLYSKIIDWLKEVDQVVVTADSEHRWLTHDMQEELLSKKTRWQLMLQSSMSFLSPRSSKLRWATTNHVCRLVCVSGAKIGGSCGRLVTRNT